MVMSAKAANQHKTDRLKHIHNRNFLKNKKEQEKREKKCKQTSTSNSSSFKQSGNCIKQISAVQCKTNIVKKVGDLAYVVRKRGKKKVCVRLIKLIAMTYWSVLLLLSLYTVVDWTWGTITTTTTKWWERSDKDRVRDNKRVPIATMSKPLLLLIPVSREAVDCTQCVSLKAAAAAVDV